jgi:hypothetical protein
LYCYFVDKTRFNLNFLFTSIKLQTPNKDKDVFWSTIFLISLIFMTYGIVWESHQSGNFQPWYLLIVMPFASLIGKKYYIVIATFCMTLFALLEYVPYLYRGDWNPPVPTILNGLTVAGIVLSVIIAIGWKVFQRGKFFN